MATASVLFTPKPSLSTLSLSKSPPKPPFFTTKFPSKLPFSRPKSFSQSTSLSDPFVLQIAETLEDSLSLKSPLLQRLRDASSEFLLSTPWPTRKDEPFRFTDTSFIKLKNISPVSQNHSFVDLFDETNDNQFLKLVFIDGFIADSLTQLEKTPKSVFIGSLSALEPSSEILKKVGSFVSGFEGDLFSYLNGVGANDLIVVYVPEGCRVEVPLLIKYYSVQGSGNGSKELPISNPRVMVVVEKGGEIGLVEEYVGGDGDNNSSYWTNSVTQFVLGEGAKVKHSYVQNQSLNAAHFKWTSVQQGSTSTYELVEVSTGGKLSRHNLRVQQLGPNTVTELSTFHLSLNDQTQDLHSQLVLDHPGGFSRQLHKCIVAHSSGQAVFDGNVKVNRYAQKTDAGQLTRSLLLEPRSTVNLKPNLQIIADDVKCSHGATISDLEEDQLFYFRARGVDLATARKALLFSFGAEVIDRLPYKFLKDKVGTQIKELFNPVTRASV